MRLTVSLLALAATLLAGGCRTWLIDRPDRTVYALIESRQQAALGAVSDAHLGHESGEAGTDRRMYDFNPRPIDPGIPEAFRTSRSDTGASAAQAKPAEIKPPAQTATGGPLPTVEEIAQRSTDEAEVGPAVQGEPSPSIFSAEQRDKVVVFGLRDALAYAMPRARELQDAKEDLYLAALDLSLERHLWTPQFVADVASDYDNLEEDADPDRAMSTVSEMAVTQRLPLGGEVSARVIHSLLREVRNLVDKGESGQVILQAGIPLLRRAGRAAYESRYSAERELIYAVRTYERFRRAFLVVVASNYLDLQQVKASLANTFRSYQTRKQLSERADAIRGTPKERSVVDAPRAKANLRDAETALVNAKERYESALDRFKIRLGLPVDAFLDVVDQDKDEDSKALDALLPDVDEATAVEVASSYRLDLLNSADQVDDMRRGVMIAKNRILPDLNLTGSVTYDSDPSQLRATTFRRERATWQGGVQLRIDDRRTERNAYRAALVARRRAERDHEIFVDTVHADVRRALRRIAQQTKLLILQSMDVTENEERLEGARERFDLGLSTNQDVVDSENDLLRARNEYAAAVAAYRVAILEFRLDTGTLRVSDDGRWETPERRNEPGGP